MALEGPFTRLPQPPRRTRTGGAPDPRELERWYDKIWRILSGIPGISWDVVDKTGSNLTDIETRNHNDLQFNRTTKTADYILARLDDTVFGDATAGLVTMTLPTAVGADEAHTVKKIDASDNFVRVAAQAGELVAGAEYFDLEDEGESITVESDGIGWYA